MRKSKKGRKLSEYNFSKRRVQKEPLNSEITSDNEARDDNIASELPPSNQVLNRPSRAAKVRCNQTVSDIINTEYSYSLEVARERSRARRESESRERRERRLEDLRQRASQRVANESSKQREQRLADLRQRALQRRSNEMLQYEILQNSNEILQKQISTLLDNQKKLRAHIRLLDITVKKNNERFAIRVKETLKHVLTPNQVDLALGKKSVVEWTDEEYAKASTLRSFSGEAYHYMREEFNYPLPEPTALQQWEAKNDAKVQNDSHNDMVKCIKFELEEIECDDVKQNENEFASVSDTIPKTEVDINEQFDVECEMDEMPTEMNCDITIKKENV